MVRTYLIVLLLLSAALALDTNVTANNVNLVVPTCKHPNVVPHAVVPPKFCPYYWASDLERPRGLVRALNGDLIVLERGADKITVLWDDDGNGMSDSAERATLVDAAGLQLTHGLAIHSMFLYASSARTVYRWRYSPGVREPLGAAEVVVKDIPCCGHTTRTIAFDHEGLLYVSVGSATNVDPDSKHARVVRFNPTTIAPGGIPWQQGEIFADGLRNEVALTADPVGRMWGVENGMDNAFREDLGGSIVRDNPSEELNLFDQPGAFYGYPQCFSSYILKDFPAGTQFADTNFLGKFDDAWCRDPRNNRPPTFNFPAHMAPLDLEFWDSSAEWPAEYSGNAFVGFHGSWNRSPPQGYRVDLTVFEDGMPVSHAPFLARGGQDATGPGWIRPVDLAVAPCVSGTCLAITSDATGHIVFVSYAEEA